MHRTITNNALWSHREPYGLDVRQDAHTGEMFIHDRGWLPAFNLWCVAGAVVSLGGFMLAWELISPAARDWILVSAAMLAVAFAIGLIAPITALNYTDIVFDQAGQLSRIEHRMWTGRRQHFDVSNVTCKVHEMWTYTPGLSGTNVRVRFAACLYFGQDRCSVLGVKNRAEELKEYIEGLPVGLSRREWCVGARFSRSGTLGNPGGALVGGRNPSDVAGQLEAVFET